MSDSSEPRPIRTYSLPAARLVEWPDHVHTFLADGSENVYYPPLTDAEYLAAVAEMGYADPMRYTVEHEIGHHVVASARTSDIEKAMERRVILARWLDGKWRLEEPSYATKFMTVSRIIYRACHSLPMSMDEQASKDEEHLVNRLQRYANLGAGDPYGELERVFGSRLPAIAASFLVLARPWLTITP